jgi:hypothetical protein
MPDISLIISQLPAIVRSVNFGAVRMLFRQSPTSRLLIHIIKTIFQEVAVGSLRPITELPLRAHLHFILHKEISTYYYSIKKMQNEIYPFYFAVAGQLFVGSSSSGLF